MGKLRIDVLTQASLHRYELRIFGELATVWKHKTSDKVVAVIRKPALVTSILRLVSNSHVEHNTDGSI